MIGITPNDAVRRAEQVPDFLASQECEGEKRKTATVGDRPGPVQSLGVDAEAEPALQANVVLAWLAWTENEQHHRFPVERGVLGDESGALLRAFFRARRGSGNGSEG